jgi:hypothetical protein
VTTPSVDPALQGALRLALAFVFALAASHKLRDPVGFRQALAGYDLLPRSWVGPVSLVVPALEAIASLALLAATVGGALLAGGLLALYTTAMAVNLLRGRGAIDCGCGGPAAPRPIGIDLVARNGVLLLAASVCGLASADRALLWPDAITIAAGAATLALLYAASEAALANAALRSEP